jgi:hypothetical protein
MPLLPACQPATGSDPAAPFRVAAEALPGPTRRVGVNLGSWSWWGAEQLGANVVMNPGFEGTIDRALVLVADTGPHRFTDDGTGLGRIDGFWAGGTFDVRTGPLAGVHGRLTDSRQAGRRGQPEFWTEPAVSGLLPGDAVAVTRIREDGLPSHWWVPDAATTWVGTDGNTRPPGSPGRRSLRLRPPSGATAEITTYFDAIGDRAGKLLPVSGTWLLSFWCRAQGPGTLAVVLARQGQAALFRRQVQPGPSWSHQQFAFTATDDGPPAILSLSFRAAGGSLYLDDVDLRAAADSGQAFRAQVVRSLRELRPGYLRDWCGQLGDALENRLAVPFARRSWRYRPGERSELLYSYSLPETMALCRQVGAWPWIIVPTTFADDECIGLGQYLARAWREGGFGELVVEFGNENWNALFRPAGIADPRVHAEAARRAFGLIRQGAGPEVPLVTVANGQYAAPERALAVAQALPEAAVLAVAPYLLPALDSGLDLPRRIEQLLADEGGRWATLATGAGRLRQQLAVAEINLHTLGGAAPPSERDALTAGAIGGVALARALLRGYGAGAGRQCAYVLAGFDARLADRDGYTRLWGLVRDLGPTCRLRPTGMAVALLNRALAGPLHAVTGTEDPTLTMVASRGQAGWGLVAVSTATAPRSVCVQFPTSEGQHLPTRLLRLDAAAPEANNEDAPRVTVVETGLAQAGSAVTFQMPGQGLVVLLPGTEDL